MESAFKKIASLIVFFLFLALGATLSPAPASAEDYLRVGLLAEPRSLNPFQASDAWTRKVNSLIYQPLYQRQPGTPDLIPWLAAGIPSCDTEMKTITIPLREMSWDDGTPFTSEDVVFTVELIRKFRIPRYYAHWEFVQSIEALDERTVRIRFRDIPALFWSRSLTSWVVQKRQWQPIVNEAETYLNKADPSGHSEEALKWIQGYAPEKPAGLGPFSFSRWVKGSFIQLKRNEFFFGKNKVFLGRTLGPYLDGVVFRFFDTLPTATVALQQGDLDFLWKGVTHSLVKDLVRQEHIKVPMTFDEGFRFLGFNLRKSPMSDPAFRKAVAYLVDKDFIVKRILHDHGQRLDTFVPPSNVFYYNPDTPQYGNAMDRKLRVEEAYRIMTAAGYKWQTPPLDAQGQLRKGAGILLPDGRPMPALTVLTPTGHYDLEIAATGQMVQEWLQPFGVPIAWRDVSFSALIETVRGKRDFDLFLMGWRNLPVDPDYLRRFFHSRYDHPNQWNYTGYRSDEFDRLADLQAETSDSGKRRDAVHQLQSRLMEDLPCVPLYVPHLMEGIRTDRLQGWVEQVGGIGNIWTFCLLRPVDQR